mmetsp:Transcript_18085/g.48085  ORF Transcript_18085/g.48085 Transcript_18085/m.48085 type:complete len:203 (-) Transcript_18085:584-1192(-)
MGGWHFLGTYQEDDTHQNNGPIDHLTGILDTVVASAHEAEYGAAFVNGQCLYNTRLTLDDLGYPQPPTPLIMDNETAVGVITGNKTQKRSKAVDMRYHWLDAKQREGTLQIIWAPGSINKADYFTKAHPAAHYRAVRDVYLSPHRRITELKGCVGVPPLDSSTTHRRCTQRSSNAPLGTTAGATTGTTTVAYRGQPGQSGIT